MQNVKIALAPMEGVVDYCIRELFSRIGGFDFCTTEFVRVTSQLLPRKVFYRYCPELLNQGKTSSGTKVYLQLLGSDPQCLLDNALKAISLGAPGIDLNFGCPAKRVNQHDGGARLLQKPERLYQIISHLRKNIPVEIPVSAKVRLGFEDKSLYREIAQAVNEAKASWISIHARTKKEAYKPPAHWEYIAKMKEDLDIPIYANGDIFSPDDYQKQFAITGISKIMLGRGAFARPSLANEIKQSSEKLTWSDMKSYVSQFQHFNLAWRGEKYAMQRLKQWLKHLNYQEAQDAFQEIKRIKDLKTELPSFLQSLQTCSSSYQNARTSLRCLNESSIEQAR